MNLVPADVIAGCLIAVGIVGLVVPVLPGLALTVGGVLLWTTEHGGATAWTVFGVCVLIALAGWVLQWTRPDRRLREAGVPGRSKFAGVVLGIVGFFVVPVVGLFAGFVLGVYLAEHLRVRDAGKAWTSTRAAINAALLSVGIELAAAVLVAITWVIGLVIVA